jgi:hypothetical protein
MRRNPLYVFNDLGSVGVFNIPLNSTVQVNDVDGMDQPVIVQINSKANMGPNTTIGEFLLLEENYTKPGTLGFVSKEDIGEPLGVAPLDASSKIPGRYMPEIQVGNVYVVGSEQEMLNLNAERGDLCVRTDIQKTFVHNGGTQGTIDDWTELLFNIGGVQSVNGQTGTVVLDTDDISQGTVNMWFTQAGFDAEFATKSIDGLSDVNTVGPAPQSGESLVWDGTAWRPRAVTGDVTSVNSQTGVVVLNSDNIDEGQGNLYFTNNRADARIQTAIDDTAGAFDTANLWSAAKIFNELSYKANNVDSGLKGFVEIAESGTDVAKLRIKKTTSNDATVIQNNGIQIFDANNVKYSIKSDEANAELDLKVNEVTGLSIREGLARHTPYQPQHSLFL